MVPVFTRVASSLKGIIEDKIDEGESIITLTPYISKATLDVIGLVGMNMIFIFILLVSCFFFDMIFFFNYEFNSLISQNELEKAYDSIMSIPITTK